MALPLLEKELERDLFSLKQTNFRKKELSEKETLRLGNPLSSDDAYGQTYETVYEVFLQNFQLPSKKIGAKVWKHFHFLELLSFLPRTQAKELFPEPGGDDGEEEAGNDGVSLLLCDLLRFGKAGVFFLQDGEVGLPLLLPLLEKHSPLL